MADFAHPSHTGSRRSGFVRHTSEHVTVAELAARAPISAAAALESLLHARETAARHVLRAAGLPDDGTPREIAPGSRGGRRWCDAEALTEDRPESAVWYAARILRRAAHARRCIERREPVAIALAFDDLALFCRLAWEWDVLGPEVMRDRATQAGRRKGGQSPKRAGVWQRVVELDAEGQREGRSRRAASKNARARRIREILIAEGHKRVPALDTIAKRLPTERRELRS